MLTVCENKALVFCRQGETLRVDAYGPGVLRVRSVAGIEVLDQNWTLLPPREAEVEIQETADGKAIVCGNVRCAVTNNGRITFTDREGKLLFQEEWTKERDLCGRYVKPVNGDLYRFETNFFPRDNEHFFGMGYECHDAFDLKGATIDLCQQNTKMTIPFVVSSYGYGFLWNNPAIGRAELGITRTRWVAEQTRQMDYMVMNEGSYLGNAKKLAEISGYTPKFPQWATGLWQSKLRYVTQEELLGVAREYHRRGIPVSMIVCDWQHWPYCGDWKYDEKYWPDPEGMVEELHSMGMELMSSVWPTVDTRSDSFLEMKEKNMLIRTDHGVDMNYLIWFGCGPQCYMDVTNPHTREYVWNKIRKNYYDRGTRHFWLDEAEPEFLPYEYDNIRYTMGAGMEMSSLYTFYYSKIFYDGLKAAGEKDILNLTRNATIGSQRLGSVVWSGDVPATFNSLRRQIKAGMNMAMCAYPWWTSDVGGFHGGDPDDEAYRELVVRWFQFSTFCPILRMHGNRYNPDRVTNGIYGMEAKDTGGPNELWSYGDRAYEIMKRFTLMREKLRPYIQEQFDLASADGTPIVRPLVMEFSDRECVSIFDQYMFGPDIMACPVYEPGVTRRQVYLPAGQTWRNAATGEKYAGGQWITAEAPLESIPLFLTEASRLPLDFFQA